MDVRSDARQYHPYPQRAQNPVGPGDPRRTWAFVRILRRYRQQPGGLHLEITPDDVTECVPLQARDAADAALPRYRAACDPRLNPAQAAEIVDWFGTLL